VLNNLNIDGCRLKILSSMEIPAYGIFTETICKNINISKVNGKNIIDLGCGSGVIGIYLLLNGAAHVLFNDIQNVAIEYTLKNLNLNNIKSGFSVYCGSFTEVNQKMIEDAHLIIFNPPQFPIHFSTSSPYPQNENIFRNGGYDGLNILRNFIKWVSILPCRTPESLLVVSSLLNKKKIQFELTKYNNLEFSITCVETVPVRESLISTISKLSTHEKNNLGVSMDANKQWREEVLLLIISKKNLL
jgi:methylase of polypeptide subunit release factors